MWNIFFSRCVNIKNESYCFVFDTHCSIIEIHFYKRSYSGGSGFLKFIPITYRHRGWIHRIRNSPSFYSIICVRKCSKEFQTYNNECVRGTVNWMYVIIIVNRVIVNRVSDELRVEKFFFFFVFCLNPNLLFIKHPSFFLCLTYTIFFLKLYSTIEQIPIFFSSS